MKNSYPNCWLVLLVLAILLLNSTQLSLSSPVQEGDKSLDIERYPDEPLELVEIVVGDQSITDKIAAKWKHQGGGRDTVSFIARDGWYRLLQARLRNVSGKRIYGVEATLHFHPSDSPTLYGLPLAATTPLGQGVLEPDAVVGLTVTDQAWNLTAAILKQYAVNPDRVGVSFGVEGVSFGGDLQWRKGKILRRDPENSLRWIPIN